METLEPTVVSEPRDVRQAIFRGLRECCPACGEGRMFRAFLKVVDKCPHCHEELHHHRADDAPPYFTILIVAHVVVGGILAMEQAFRPADWVQAVIWIPIALLMSLLVLPRIKGALVGLQWALRMHGFGGTPDEPMQRPMPAHLAGGGEQR